MSAIGTVFDGLSLLDTVYFFFLRCLLFFFFSPISNHSDLFLLLFYSSLDKRRDGKSVAGNQFTLPGRERN